MALKARIWVSRLGLGSQEQDLVFGPQGRDLSLEWVGMYGEKEGEGEKEIFPMCDMMK